MRNFVGCMFIVLFLVWFIMRCVFGIQLQIAVTGHLKRAADANTISLAQKELTTALQEIERRGLKTGYTSIFFQTPDEDIEFWYNNLSSASKELEILSPDASQLEKSNILMKLRETLLDKGENGAQHVTCPDGLSIYPRNVFFAIWGLISLLGAVGYFMVIFFDN